MKILVLFAAVLLSGCSCLCVGGPKAPARAAAAPAPAPAPKPEKVTIALEVKFDTDKDVVKPEYDDQLKKVADFLKEHPGAKAEIEGHTDNEGKPEYNKDLSQRRAAAVRQALIDRFGSEAARLTAAGYGAEKPLVANDTSSNRAANRRVVATFTGF